MNNSRFFLLLVFCVIHLAGCSTAGISHTFTPKPAKSNQAVVYFYRPASMANAIYSPEIYVNGESRLSIKNGQNFRLTLPPDEVTFEIEPDGKYSGITHLTLNLLPGEAHFIRIDTDLKIENSASYEPYRRSFNLVKVDEKQAISQIAECCVNSDKETGEIKETSSTTVESDDGFSVNKTQNPFSH